MTGGRRDVEVTMRQAEDASNHVRPRKAATLSRFRRVRCVEADQ